MYRKRLGDYGEYLARTILEEKGYFIRDAKYHTRYGELDLIATEGKYLVFVEVKTRIGQRFGSGLTAMTKTKQQSLIRSAGCYLWKKGLSNQACRFDLLSLTLDRRGKLRAYDLVVNAFEAEGGNYY